MTRRLPLATLAVLLATGAFATPALAGGVAEQPRADSTPFQDAGMTRERLREVLNEYPPSVAQVLRLDPSLLTRPDYLAPYPSLASFLTAHPDVVRNPSYYFGDAVQREDNVRLRTIGMVQDAVEACLMFSGFTVLLLVLGWLVRTALADRRWQRLTRTQTDAHTKLLDRLTSHDDLLAYIQSPAGKRFLEAAPMPLDDGARVPLHAPMARILWSLQAGIVLVAVGFGVFFAKNHVLPEVSAVFYVLGDVVIALGVGFVASAFLAYGLSHRLGLLTQAAPHDA